MYYSLNGLEIKLDAGASLPIHGSELANGYDLKAISFKYDEERNQVVYNTGIHIATPPGVATFLLARSSVAKYDLILSNGIGLIDPDYRGPIKAKFNLIKPFDKAKIYSITDRICQLVFVPTLTINSFLVKDELSETVRGEGGFGHTGN